MLCSRPHRPSPPCSPAGTLDWFIIMVPLDLEEDMSTVIDEKELTIYR